MLHQNVYFYILIIVFFTPSSMLQSSKNSIPRWVSRLYINMKGEGELQKRYICFSQDCGFKKQKHLFTRFQDVDFNFTHFANFKFADFEIEVKFGLIWVNLKNGRFH